MIARCALFGRDHGRYADRVVEALPGARTACALSVGADPRSPSARFKGDPLQPNEDAVLALDDGRRVLLAVADSHFGAEASHLLIAHLAALPAVPAAVDGLLAWLDAGARPDLGPDPSASTLAVAVLDRPSGQGYGLSIGDSTCALLSPEAGFVRLGAPSPIFVHPHRRPVPSRLARPFAFTAAAGSLLLAFTDGVDECHYRHPETSLGPAHLVALFAEVGADAAVYADRLCAWALAGVDGHPGGQDNVAIAVSAA